MKVILEKDEPVSILEEMAEKQEKEKQKRKKEPIIVKSNLTKEER